MSDNTSNGVVALDANQSKSIALLSDAAAPSIIQDALQKTIKLFTTNVAGVTHLEDSSVLTGLYVGQELKLQRGSFVRDQDSYAIKLLTETGVKIGYVPKRVNIVFANMMDQGLALKAKIAKIDDSYSYKLIEIDLILSLF